jgi:hypothetical protein
VKYNIPGGLEKLIRLEKRMGEKGCSHIFGKLFFFVSTLCFGGDSAKIDYLRVAERSNYTPAQRKKFFTAETQGKNEKKIWPKICEQNFSSVFSPKNM